MTIESILLEILGWTGLIVIISAFFANEIKLLRILSIVGGLMLLWYYLVLWVPVAIVTNLVIVSINLFYIYKDKFNDKNRQQ